MPDLINPVPNSLIVNPATGDPDRAGDIIEELMGVMKRHGCVLMLSHRRNEIVLAKVTDPAMYNARVIAGIKDISPFAATWRKIEQRKTMP